MRDNLSIKNETRHAIPRVPFGKIKNAVLGGKYDLSLVFVTHKTSHKFNRMYRGKNKPTNILSFPYEKNKGEILIDIKKTDDEAKALKKPLSPYLKFLFIHGLLHLKGMLHGSKMENEESKLLKKFN